MEDLIEITTNLYIDSEDKSITCMKVAFHKQQTQFPTFDLKLSITEIAHNCSVAIIKIKCKDYSEASNIIFQLGISFALNYNKSFSFENEIVKTIATINYAKTRTDLLANDSDTPTIGS